MTINDNKTGGIKSSTLVHYEKEHASFIRKLTSRRTINWSVITVFLLGLFVVVFLSVFPIFSVRFRVQASSFDKPLDKKIIDDYYSMDPTKKKQLPFGDQFVEATTTDELKSLLSQETLKVAGKYGVYIKKIDTGEEIGVNENQSFTAASLTKLYVAGAYYKKLQDEPTSFGNEIVLKNEDMVAGNGDVSNSPPGSEFYSSDLVKNMLNQSDNTAFAVLVRELGINYVDSYIKEIGVNNSDFEQNIVSPKDIGIFFDKLYNDELMNKDLKDEMVSHLENTVTEDRIPFYLPSNTKVAHKIGTWDGAYSDAGIVYSKNGDYIIVVMTDGADYGEAINTIRKISEVVYSYFNKD